VRAEVGAIPFVLCLNKADLKAEWEIDREVLAARAGGWSVVETSARLGTGVDEAFTLLTRRMLEAAAARA
jgi:Fe2+ transport system protein B